MSGKSCFSLGGGGGGGGREGLFGLLFHCVYYLEKKHWLGGLRCFVCDCSSVNWTAPCPPSCQPREPGPQTRAQRRLVHHPFFSSPVSWGIEIGLFQFWFCCYCVILFIFNEVTLLNLTLFSYNFYTWLIVMFCLFVKSLCQWNVTKIHSCVHLNVIGQ